RVFTFTGGQFSTNDLLLNSSFALGTPALSEAPGAGSDSVALTATPPTSVWTATANAPWLHLTPGNQSGMGSTNVVFSFDANPGPTRIGTVTIAGQTLTVTQAGSTYVTAGPLTTLASGANGLAYPDGLAVDGAGNVYIANTYYSQVLKWTVANNAVSTLVATSTGLRYPAGVAPDGAGNVYFSDSGNNTIKKWI